MRTIRYKSIKEMLNVYVDYTFKLAQSLDKNIYKFEIDGDHIKVDPDRISPFIKSLIHVFRNAVDHGIEIGDERLEAGKDILGKITCIVEKTDTSISITIKDDGKGIDIEEIKEKAINRGLISEDTVSNLTDEQLIDLIFCDNFSTKNLINELSGRGYGLSAVKREMDNLHGTIQVETSLGKGTKFVFTFSS